MLEDLSPWLKDGFAQVTWAIFRGHLQTHTGSQVNWASGDQIFPISKRTKRMIFSPGYKDYVDNIKAQVAPRPYFHLVHLEEENP
jgi:hypothetical protein